MIDKHACALRTLRGAYGTGSVGPIGHAAFALRLRPRDEVLRRGEDPVIIERAAPLPN